jgi:ATP-dependent helicase/nuclease subunit A
MSSRVLPPDQKARDRIEEDLVTTLLVEAAAGTGKTASLVNRMAALVSSGRCSVETLAAVTFTRKAAAELRGRFTAVLKMRVGEAEGEERERLAAAVERSERCFIGTIHSFCARLLRERPVEAGVDVSFTDLDEAADRILREEAWDEFVDRLFAGDPVNPILEQLAAVGLEIGQLREAFFQFADYPDVGEWPAGNPGPGDPKDLGKDLEDYLDRIRRLVPDFPDDKGTDKLMGRYEQIERTARLLDLSRTSALMDLLELFDVGHGARQKHWPGGPEQAKSEIENWESFRAKVASPALVRWRELRYVAVIPVLQAAVGVYDDMRRERGALNYQDLLLSAARLLRDRPAVRTYFRRRFTHLLVDEFQDTDPIQAEVVLYLTAVDAKEEDWRRCRPVPGSLFVVGDPKQSIYRFRRADIVTYDQVKKIIEESGGAVLSLETSFRTTPSLIGWGNAVFDGTIFTNDDYSPGRQTLLPWKDEEGAPPYGGLRTITVPGECSTDRKAALYDADFIARFIRMCIDERQASPEDFLVVTWTKKRLHLYADAFQRLGVPHRVTGGSAWCQVKELKLMARCLRAVVEPENPVALVGVLRGELFGLDDTELYAFRKTGARFSFTSSVPGEGLERETACRFEEAFELLRRFARRLRVMSPVAALERTAAELGLQLRALLSPGGNGRSGTIGKAFAVLREAQRELHSAAELADYLEELIAEEREFDGLPARAAGEGVVQVMNLHKAKGLEAKAVFLADPGGGGSREPGMHIDRSGGLTRGYLAVSERSGSWGRKTLAQPAGWGTFIEKEKMFGAAERNRLLYVAATRAKSMISVTQRVKGKAFNPWQFFQGRLANAEELEEPGPREAPFAGKTTIGAEEVRIARETIARRWGRSLKPGYSMKGAREIAVSASELHGRRSGRGEHGTEWGTVIHFLLETAMREPERDLGELARYALEEQGLIAGLEAVALKTVAAVRSAEIWKRACSAEERLVEVPFEICLEADDPLLRGGERLPTLLRGVVDLAFREGAGWVVADWKTDADAAARRDALASRYRGQTELYAALWERLTGEPVVETGIFFVSSGEYVKLGGEGGPNEQNMKGKTAR